MMSLKSVKSVLLVEDNPGDARLLYEMFKEQGADSITLTHLTSMRETEKHLAEQTADLILLDLGLQDTQGLGTLRRAHAAAPRVPLVVLASLDNESLATQALQQGAQDYLIKDEIEPRSLFRALRHAIERKTLEDAWFAEKERAFVTLNCIGDAVACTDLSGNVTFLNVVAEHMTGWSRQEAAGRPLGEIFPIVDTTTRESIQNLTDMVVSQRPHLHPQSNLALTRRDGCEIPVEESVALIHDREGQPAGAVLVFRDVSATRAMALEMHHSARHDFLTGLPNRMLLNERIGQSIALARRHMKNVAVLFLDVDRFKHINDSLGHLVGDRLLQSVAKRLVDCVRSVDTVSRQGGDEFVVLLTEVEQSEDIPIAASRVLEAVEGRHSLDPHDLSVTTSVGVSVYPDDGLDAETLIKHADAAMYQIKENGGHGYRLFKPSMSVQSAERESIELDLRRALERQEFVLHYQPKINLRTGDITGAEALIRWIHPTRGTVAPLQFIPVAEDCGLILPIGHWVIREACTQARAWVDAGLPLATMSVNISGTEFRDEKFVEGLFGVLQDTGVDPSALVLDLAGGVLMKHVMPMESTIKALRATGVQLAVDDVGTRYSNLSYLRKLPIDILKINQSFVRQIAASPNETGPVTAVIGIGQKLNLQVVAEGVETQEELVFLRAHRCDEAQGFHISPPVLHGQFARLLETGLTNTLLH